MAREKLVSTLWRCDYRQCKAATTSEEVPQGWVSIVGQVQDSHGGGPGYVDLCSKHSQTLNIHRDTDDLEAN